ncbi:MAG: hypothetical protein QOK44_1446 [Betaproteobacteria bacterium]|jgi:hypothetical protein|nr:hypothetical protein [Betaproteobacteria bacterium]
MDEQAKSTLERAVGDGRHEFGSFFLSHLFGMEVAYDDDGCTVSFEITRQLFNPQGSLHGGVLATALALQLPFPQVSESMGNHDSKIVDAASVDRRDACVVGGVAS